MVTKAQCIFKKALNEFESALMNNRNPGLVRSVISAFNAGKKYASEMIFQNDEDGLDEGLEGYTPSFIVYSILGEDSSYNANDPFFTVDGNGIRSLNTYDIERMASENEDIVRRLTSWDVVQFLSSFDLADTFVDTYVYENYPQLYKTLDFDYFENEYSVEDFYNQDWDDILRDWQTKVQQAESQQDLREHKVVRLTGKDLQEMTDKILTQLKNK